MTEKDNMALWRQVEKSNPDYVKAVNYGKRHFSTIDAYSQIMRATELWGPFGKTWGVRSEVFTLVGDTILYQAEFYYPDGTFPMHASIKASADDWAKKVATDALTKALSKLGFNADVFLGKFDDNKYVQERKAEVAGERKTSGSAQQPPEATGWASPRLQYINSEAGRKLLEEGQARVASLSEQYEKNREWVIERASAFEKDGKVYTRKDLAALVNNKTGNPQWLQMTVHRLGLWLKCIDDGDIPGFGDPSVDEIRQAIDEKEK